MKVCVLGLGEVGFPTAKYVADKGIEVAGYDIKQEAIDRAKTQARALVWRRLMKSRG
jgi:UDP-N-acetyl-D-mannosaminuronate dehydrogenase